MKLIAEVYGRDACPRCAKVMTALGMNGVAYRYRDVTTKNSDRECMIRKWKEKGLKVSTPLVIINGKFIGGLGETIKYLADTLYD